MIRHRNLLTVGEITWLIQIEMKINDTQFDDAPFLYQAIVNVELVNGLTISAFLS